MGAVLAIMFIGIGLQRKREVVARRLVLTAPFGAFVIDLSYKKMLHVTKK